MAIKKSKQVAGFALAGLTVAVLSACGGGSSAVLPTLTIKGTAATGPALVNATVTVTCAQGSGTTTTDANGNYSVTFPAVGPCVVVASGKDAATGNSVTLSSIATPTAAAPAAVANVNPITTAVVAALETAKSTAAAPVTSVTQLVTLVTAVVNPQDVSNALTATITALNNLLPPALQLSTNVMSGTYVAATATTGNSSAVSTADLALQALTTGTVTGPNGFVQSLVSTNGNTTAPVITISGNVNTTVQQQITSSTQSTVTPNSSTGGAG